MVPSPSPRQTPIGAILPPSGGSPTNGPGNGGGGGLDLVALLGSGPLGPSFGLALLAAIVGVAVYSFTFMAGPYARRRRRTASATAGGPDAAATSNPPAVAVAIAHPPPDVVPEEVGVPRWRRASVQATRRSADRGPIPEHVPTVFRAPVAANAVRRRIGYRLVRVSSLPDEFRGEEVGQLDRGDEVEVLRASGAYRLVRLPDGTEGWIHKMTLADEDLDA